MVYKHRTKSGKIKHYQSKKAYEDSLKGMFGKNHTPSSNRYKINKTKRKNKSRRLQHRLTISGKAPTQPSTVQNDIAFLKSIVNDYEFQDDFVHEMHSEGLMDLSNRELHRFGRAIDEDGFTVATIPQSALQDIWHQSQGSDDLSLQYKAIYDAINTTDNTIIIYRAVPVDVNDIEIGDYIALNPKYAEDHQKSVLEGQFKQTGKLLSKTVKKEDVIWGGADYTEWAYSPKAFRDAIGAFEEFYNKHHKNPKKKVYVRPEPKIRKSLDWVKQNHPEDYQKTYVMLIVQNNDEVKNKFLTKKRAELQKEIDAAKKAGRELTEKDRKFASSEAYNFIAKNYSSKDSGFSEQIFKDKLESRTRHLTED